MTRLTS